jgi:hypothetical protein
MSRALHQPGKTTQTIGSIFTGKGYDATKLNALAHLFHITGSIDGIIKSAPPSAEEISLMLESPVTTDQLNGRLQENYFQKYRGSGERQQIQSSAELEPHRRVIAELFRTLGYIDAVVPSKARYDIAFVYGCAQTGLEERINSLKNLQEGRFLIGHTTPLEVGQVFILAGDRLLWPDRESTAVQLFAQSAGVSADLIQGQVNEIFTSQVRERNDSKEITEKRAEAIKLLTTKYKQPWPTEADMARELARTMLSGKSVAIVNAKGRDGKRPDTLDTVNEWNNTFGCRIKADKSILAISNQPFITEQYIPLRVLDNSKFPSEIVGNACNADEVKPELLLASFAMGFNRELLLEKFKATTKEEKERILPDRLIEVETQETRRHGYNGIYNPNKASLPMTR